MSIFLTFEQVLSIHERMVDEFGGDATVRDHGLLESAVSMPRQQFSGVLLHETIAEQAAAYLFHICQNHPFVDGNKRTALAAAEVFLLINKCSLKVTDKQLEKLTIAVADGTLAKGDVVEFFIRKVRC